LFHGFSSPAALRDTHGDNYILDLDPIAIELAALRIDPFPRRQIELPQMGCTGEDVPLELPIGECGLLMGTIPLIGANVSASQVDEEDALITYLDISQLTLPEIV